MHDIVLEKIIVGPLSVNCYIMGCSKSKKMAVIDPGGDADKIWQKIQKIGYSFEYIINTHGHPDHTAGNKELKEKSLAKILSHPDDVAMMTTRENLFSSIFDFDPSPPPDQLITEGQVITLGDISLKVIHTPGHSPGGICLLSGNIIFTGDTLFADGIGRTDFPGGNYAQLISSIKNKLYTLDDQLRILPGHGEESTMGKEKRNNPFVRAD